MHWFFLTLWAFAPLYVWRFSFFGLPTNFLMLLGFFVIGVVFYFSWRKDHLAKFIVQWKLLPKPVKLLSGLFFLAVMLSLLVGGVSMEKFGQWIVLYVQPVTLAMLAYAYLAEGKDWRSKVVHLLYLMVALAGWLALVQYFTLWTLPIEYAGNPVEPKRAIAFWSHPNGYGLFVVPILAWLLPDLARRFTALLSKFNKHDFWALVCWLFGAAGIVVSLSRGAWLGLTAALLVSVLFFGSKKFKFLTLGLVILMASVIYLVPSLNTRIMAPFTVGEQSANSRLSLWRAGLNGIVDAPIFGKGITGFSNNWDNYNPDPKLSHHNYPHNIFLNFWIETGLLGVVSFTLLCLYFIYRGWKDRRNPYVAGLALFLVAMFVHGMIDNPYFKNDLALIFWLMLALSLVPEKASQSELTLTEKPDATILQ